MLDQIIEHRWLHASGVLGLFPANAVGDDIEVYSNETRQDVLTVLHQLRQQAEHRPGVPHRSLADFVAPKSTGIRDYVGAFAVTAGMGSAAKVRSSRRTSTTTARSCWSRWPTGSRRRSPSGCTSGSAPTTGVTRPTSRSMPLGCSRRSTRASGPRRVIRPAPSTPRSRCCGTCSTSRRTPASSSPTAWRCGPAPP